jgi:hypothetical protein
MTADQIAGVAIYLGGAHPVNDGMPVRMIHELRRLEPKVRE